MTFRAFSRFVVPTILACAVVSACSSTPATPRAYVSETLMSGATSGTCNISGGSAVLTIGTSMINQAVERVASGTVEGGSVDIHCTVAAASGGFRIALNASLNSMLQATGGSLQATGTVDATQGGSNIDVTVNNAGTGIYQESDCTITYMFDLTTGLSPALPAAAPGRIWGHLDCPNAVDANASSGGGPVACHVQADFVFENCDS